jgi:hypothetical protein
VPRLSPDILFVPRRPNYVGTRSMPVHSGPWGYLTDVPLVLYGPGHVAARGGVGRPATMADLAPTSAGLIGYPDFPPRAGRALTEALKADQAGPPRLVVTIVWDGGGDNVLRAHPRAWPYLARLARRGTSYPRMSIGSSPSVTPPVHATLGTGAWPAAHGIPGLRIRSPEGEYVDPLLYVDPSNLRRLTLADLYDRARENRPMVGMVASGNWHIGMVGHGAPLAGGDRDSVVLVDEFGETYSNEAIYRLPPVEDLARLEEVTDALDRADGKADARWRNHDLNNSFVRYASPAATRYEEWLLHDLIQREGFGADAEPDLLYVNFKAADVAGHRWGMTSAEVGDVLRAQDHALRRLVSFLDATVGRRRWALMLTADHGQTPYPWESGGWAIAGGELKDDANRALDAADDGAALVDRVVSAGAYVRAGQLAANDLSLRAVARWMARYSAGANHKGREELPRYYEGERATPLFDAIMVGQRVVFRSCGQHR